MEEKKLIKSPIVIALYVVAALALIYTFYQIGSTVKYINSYYSSYGMSAGFGETLTYVLQSVFQPLVSTVLVAAAAVILNEVRALNPENYATAEELAAKKEAKAIKKANAKAAKAAKKGDINDEIPYQAPEQSFEDLSNMMEEPIGFRIDNK